MNKKFLKAFIIMISSFATSIGLAACSGSSVGNQTSDNPTSNPTTDTPTSSSTPSTSTPTTEDHSHNYDQQVVDDIYKASDADCEHAATYFYSCSCGDRCSETFEYGNPLGHYYQWEYFETSEGECWHRERCSRCDKTGEIKLVQSVNNLSFEVISEEEKTCKVIGYKKYYNDERDNTIIIPRIWKGYSVTSIGDYAFYGCTSLTSIVIPDSVTSIRDNAFSGCTSLTSIVIPNSVTSIGKWAFSGCTSLTTVIIGNRVTSIGYRAFYGCTSLADVYYAGTEEQWKAISIDRFNDRLTSATIHYNYKGE